MTLLSVTVCLECLPRKATGSLSDLISSRAGYNTSSDSATAVQPLPCSQAINDVVTGVVIFNTRSLNERDKGVSDACLEVSCSQRRPA